ncbi:MAG: EF-P lysine aminoacylase EpmA [Planctomycetaceae bacterium]
MMAERDYLPTARIETLQARARILRVVRDFFESRGYWEVETPIVSHDVVVDAHLNPFATSPNESVTATDSLMYLQTSPEFAMKRLLAAGADAMYQISKVFRRGEAGRNHNPEFTMIEWYRLGTTYIEQMQFVEDFVMKVLGACHSEPLAATKPQLPSVSPPMDRMTYDEAFERAVGSRVLNATVDELKDVAHRHDVVPPPGLSNDDRDGWLNWLLAELVEPMLAREQAVFVYDFPASQAALARVRNDAAAPVAERFELYLHGVEICNGYQELTDADELRRRNVIQAGIRRREGHPPLPQESRLLAAMESGFPECSGVALGFDRLFMLGMGCESIAEVIAFPFDRA